MKLELINFEATIERTKKLLAEDPNVSPALNSSIELLLILVMILINRLGLNSKQSLKAVLPIKEVYVHSLSKYFKQGQCHDF
jgi:hypothetical protein